MAVHNKPYPQGMKEAEKKLRCSIGVMAYNEEANIGYLLESLSSQRLSTCDIVEIVVVASGCTDRTEEIVRSAAGSKNQIKLLVQEKREGKASAINHFLSKAKADVVVIESGDTIPEADTIDKLVRPFFDPGIGMTGARPVPVNPTDTFMGFTVNLFWKLHHELALNHPKMGELIAFRNILESIPNDTAVDEASIEALITEAGYRICYVHDAIVHNKGPEMIRDFFKQRRRITVGHMNLRMTRGYVVSTTKLINLFGLVGRLLRKISWSPKIVLWTCGAIVLEVVGRMLGKYDFYVKKKNPFAWDIAESTKNLINDPTHT